MVPAEVDAIDEVETVGSTVVVCVVGSVVVAVVLAVVLAVVGVVGSIVVVEAVVEAVVVVGVVGSNVVVVGAKTVLESQSSLLSGLALGSAELSTAQLDTMVPAGTSDWTRYSISTEMLAPLKSGPKSHVTVRSTTLHAAGIVMTVYSNGNTSVMVTERASFEPRFSTVILKLPTSLGRTKSVQSSFTILKSVMDGVVVAAVLVAVVVGVVGSIVVVVDAVVVSVVLAVVVVGVVGATVVVLVVCNVVVVVGNVVLLVDVDVNVVVAVSLKFGGSTSLRRGSSGPRTV